MFKMKGSRIMIERKFAAPILGVLLLAASAISLSGCEK